MDAARVQPVDVCVCVNVCIQSAGMCMYVYMYACEGAARVQRMGLYVCMYVPHVCMYV